MKGITDHQRTAPEWAGTAAELKKTGDSGELGKGMEDLPEDESIENGSS